MLSATSRHAPLALLTAVSLSALGCPGPATPPTKAVAIESRPGGEFVFTVPGGDGQPRPYVVLEGPGARLVGVGGGLELDEMDSARIAVSSAALGETNLSVRYSGHGVLHLGGLALQPTPQTNVGVPDYGWIVLASGGTVPFDPQAEGEPIWLQLWEGRAPAGEALRIEIVGSLAFPNEPLRVCWSRGARFEKVTTVLSDKNRKAWPGRSPSGVGGLRFDFEAGVAKGAWKLWSEEGAAPEVELRLVHNGPWAPGSEGTAPVTSSSQGG